MLGINKETGLATLTKDPQEKEDCRNIWWAIYRVDQFMALIGKGLLVEEDNGIYLPGAANYIQSDDDIRSLGLEVMASRKWFTPIVYMYTLARRLLDLDEVDILQEYRRFSFVDNLQIADGDKVLREFLNDDIEMNQ
ncbi:hypothetical protein HK103_001610 [Boothiomyces macroporosus]|uniref:Transcription factor domain-containing protein n=1 Tax=Boothiomyces macroporosus TaxID=261099 RepID=A0AAD5Y0H7_9FUNG|nr:hypothetical protein HK103_001610 [Boothiomyces macroporosus]